MAPLSIGPLRIIGHRGTALERALPQPKDEVNAVLRDERKKVTGDVDGDGHPLIPRPRTAVLPSVHIGLQTNSSKYIRRSSFERRISDLNQVKTIDELVEAVVGWIDSGLSRAQGKQCLVLIGDSHDADASSAVKLAALKPFRGQAGATLLLEMEPETLPDHRSRALLSAYKYSQDADTENEYQIEKRKDEEERGSLDLSLSILVGAHLGIASDGFDPANEAAASYEDREEAMLLKIQEVLARGHGPTIVHMGSAHLPALKAHFERLDTLAVIPVSYVDRSNADFERSFERKRMSELLADNEVFLVCPTDELRQTRLNPLGMTRDQMNVELREVPPLIANIGAPGAEGCPSLEIVNAVAPPSLSRDDLESLHMLAYEIVSAVSLTGAEALVAVTHATNHVGVREEGDSESLVLRAVYRATRNRAEPIQWNTLACLRREEVVFMSELAAEDRSSQLQAPRETTPAPAGS